MPRCQQFRNLTLGFYVVPKNPQLQGGCRAVHNTSRLKWAVVTVPWCNVSWSHLSGGWCDLAKTASLRWVLHRFTLPTAVLYLVGFLAVPGLLQRSLPSLSHSSTLIKYYGLTTLISEISDFIGIAICSSYPWIYVYCGGCQPYVQSHVAFMACQIINFLDLLLSFSQQVIAWGYFVPDPQVIQLIITVPLLPAELCPLGTWQASATAVRLPLPPSFCPAMAHDGTFKAWTHT